MSAVFDAVVIGAGHNGLAAAATLAGKGKSVCVVERADAVGGMAKTVDLAEGARGPQLAHLLYNLNPVVARELGIGGKVPLDTRVLDTVALSPKGRHVVIRGDQVQFSDGSGHHDAAAYMALTTRLRRFSALLGQMALRPPPSLDGGLLRMAVVKEVLALGRLGVGLKRLGKAEMREFLRVILSNAYDLILDDIPDGPLAGALAADAVRGAYAGPRAPGTVFSLMYRLGNGGEIRLPMGGMGAVADAFADAARQRGVVLRTGVGVSTVLVEQDRACGVMLADGTRLSARAVLSGAGARATMQMAGVAHFDIEAARRLRNLRAKGTVAKVNLVLKEEPQFTGLNPEQMAARLLIAPSAAAVERAFNPAKYGGMSGELLIEAVIPSLSDATLCRDGQHVLSAVVSYVPHALEGGWSDAARASLEAAVVARLAQFAPGIEALVTRAEVLTPVDIETLTGAPGGHWHHAEMGIDQILTVRPVNLMAQYRFGVPGLYLCGASAHPGGDVTGAAGRNAALQVLRDGGLTG